MNNKIVVALAACGVLGACQSVSPEMAQMGAQILHAGIQAVLQPAEQPTNPPVRKPNPRVQTVGIGAGEASDKTHLAFGGLPKDLVYASVRVKVNQTLPTGINFFALQVNFPNGTWAHGGIQYNHGRDWNANWGGLVNRGGGSADYRQADPLQDLQKIQNPPPEQRTAPFKWQPGKVYILTVQRGERYTLPAGEYIHMNKKQPVYVPNDRQMWAWHFTAEPEDGRGDSFHEILYTAADTFHSFYVWNECTRDKQCGRQQHATWSLPQYARSVSPMKAEQASQWQYF